MYINSMQQRVKIPWVSPRVGTVVSASSLDSFPGIVYDFHSPIQKQDHQTKYQRSYIAAIGTTCFVDPCNMF